jgi:hypothetical protein
VQQDQQELTDKTEQLEQQDQQELTQQIIGQN